MIFPKQQKFRMGYLSGFYAEKRDIERKELEEEVHRESGKIAPGESAGRYDSRI